AGPRTRAAGGAALYPAPALAERAGPRPLLLRVLEPVSLAALPPAARADPHALPLLAALRRGQSPLRGRGAGGDGERQGCRLVPGLPSRHGAGVRPGRAARPAALTLLAHPVSAARGLPHRDTGTGTPRGAPRQRPARVSPPALLRQLPALCRECARRGRRLGAARGNARGSHLL